MQKNNISLMVKFHRKKSGLTQGKLAELGGIGKTAVFDIEKGKPTVRLDTLKRVLHVLNIKLQFVSPLMEQFEESIDERG